MMNDYQRFVAARIGRVPVSGLHRFFGIAAAMPDEIGKMDEFIKAGEEAALEKIDEIKKLIFSEEEILTTDLHRWTQIL